MNSIWKNRVCLIALLWVSAGAAYAQGPALLCQDALGTEGDVAVGKLAKRLANSALLTDLKQKQTALYWVEKDIAKLIKLHGEGIRLEIGRLASEIQNQQRNQRHLEKTEEQINREQEQDVIHRMQRVRALPNFQAIAEMQTWYLAKTQKIVGSTDEEFLVYDLSRTDDPPRVLVKRPRNFLDLRFSHDERFVILKSSNQTNTAKYQLINIQTGESEDLRLPTSDSRPYFLSDGSIVFVPARLSKTPFRLWKPGTPFKDLEELAIEIKTNDLISFETIDNSNYTLVQGTRGLLAIFDLQKRKLIAKYRGEGHSWRTSAFYNPSHDRVYFLDSKNQTSQVLAYFDFQSGKLHRPDFLRGGYIGLLAIDSGKKVFLYGPRAASGYHKIQLIDLQKEREVKLKNRRLLRGFDIFVAKKNDLYHSPLILFGYRPDEDRIEMRFIDSRNGEVSELTEWTRSNKFEEPAEPRVTNDGSRIYWTTDKAFFELW